MAIALEQHAREDSRGVNDFLVPVISQCETNRLEGRGQREPLRIVGRDEQRDGRDVDRLVVTLLDHLADRQHADVLEHDLALLLGEALGRACDDDVDVAVRRDESAHARDVVDLDRHAPHARVDHEREQPGALADHLRLEDRLVPLDVRDGHASGDRLEVAEGAVRLRLDRPRHQPQLVLLDAGADPDRLTGDGDLDDRPVRRPACRLQVHPQLAEVAVRQGCTQCTDQNRQQ